MHIKSISNNILIISINKKEKLALLVILIFITIIWYFLFFSIFNLNFHPNNFNDIFKNIYEPNYKFAALIYFVFPFFFILPYILKNLFFLIKKYNISLDKNKNNISINNKKIASLYDISDIIIEKTKTKEKHIYSLYIILKKELRILIYESKSQKILQNFENEIKTFIFDYLKINTEIDEKYQKSTFAIFSD